MSTTLNPCPLCHARTAQGKDLDFIASIHRDGSGVTPVAGKDLSLWNNTTFRLACLSITQGTYIASEFHTYVVRMKPEATAPNAGSTPAATKAGAHTMRIAPSILQARATACSRDLERMPGGEELKAAALHVEATRKVEFPYDFELCGYQWSATVQRMDSPVSEDDCYVAHIDVQCIAWLGGPGTEVTTEHQQL
jgi:hypothetical protein